MRKTDKKIDTKIRQQLTTVCDFALQNISGYQWITHSVNYKQFPDSLQITCMFENQHTANHAKQQGELLTLIVEKLKDISVHVKAPQKQVHFNHAEMK